MRKLNQIVALLPLVLLAACGGRGESEGMDGPRRLINVDDRGVALQGYDPVAYFTDNKPVKGDAMWASTSNGGTYHFASAEHKTMFDADPGRYEPQFGGYCGYAASINKVSPIEVEWFEILDGRLVLQHNAKALNGRMGEWPNGGMSDSFRHSAIPPFLHWPHSHSIVAGGFELTSYTTRFTPSTSLAIRFATRANTSGGKANQSAVMPSRLVTARRPTT